MRSNHVLIKLLFVEHPVTRILTLLELLQAYRRLSGTELARRLEVSPRTVRRYVADLHEIGIPVDAEAGRYGGYRLRPGYKLPPLMLTSDEALAVVLGLLAGRRLGLLAPSTAVEGALAKLDRVLPDALRDQVHATQRTVGLGLTAASATWDVDTGAVLSLSGAAHDRRQVRIRYRARTEAATERVVDPYGIVFQSGRWYLTGWDHLRGAERTFRLDRIQSHEVTESAFERPARFDAVAHVQRSIARAPSTWSVEAVLDLAPEEARRRVPLTVGTLEPEAEGVRLTLEVDDLDWAARYLVGLDCRFTVRCPHELRETLRQLAATLVDACNVSALPAV